MILKDKRIWITGASSGIGRATAIMCAQRGASIIISGRNEEKLRETASAIPGATINILPFKIDDFESLDSIVDSIGCIDGFVNSAGINDKTLVKSITLDKLDKMFHTNVYGPVLLIKQMIKRKKLNPGSSIVFLSSISTVYSTISNALYSSSKGAIESFAKVLALELAPKSIRVNCIRPGAVNTPILGAYSLDDEMESFKKQFPLGRIAQPAEIAEAISFLLSDASKWTTGSIMTIDGGITLR